MAKFTPKTATKNDWAGTLSGANVTIVAIDIENEEFTYVNTAGETLKAAWSAIVVTEGTIVPA